MLIGDSFLYLHADRKFYEPLDRYPSDQADFAEPVRRNLPSDWGMERRKIWFHCSPPARHFLAQGWKIHLSATLGNSAAVLTAAVRLLVKHGVPFKFAADKHLLFLLNGKRWSRGGAGKFVTIYPADTGQCGRLLELLYQAMIGYSGPYILSDRRYRDSMVVYYRYGGILPTRRMEITGSMVPVMQLSDGQFVDDERTPYFRLPEGMIDPFVFEEETADSSSEGTLKDGRYLIESVLSFSNSGGVYKALDRETGDHVVIKEARPFTSVSPRGTDAVWLLKKEHRLLTLLEEIKLAPRPVDFFKDWDHYYLVEEFIEGNTLRAFTSHYSLNLRTRASRDYAREFYARYSKVFIRIAQVLQELHEHRVVFSDLSHYNIMVLNEGEDIRLIDFEGAYEQGVDPPTFLYTPGFAPLQMVDEGLAQREDDLFGLGGLMLAALIPINSLMALKPQAHEPFLQAMYRDIALPEEVGQCIGALLDQDRNRRPLPEQVVEVLERDYPIRSPDVTTLEAEQEDLHLFVQRLVGGIESMADFAREDRLFPADPAVFETNPLSLAHGACGVAYALKRVTGGVRQDILEWILKQPLSVEAYPPGLWVGLSGIAWALLELGCREQAEEALRVARRHHLLWRSSDLFFGAAGWGMTQLQFFLATGDESYLIGAREAGAYLLKERREEKGACWWQTQGGVCCGLAHGVAGISLFLLYLHSATLDEQYLTVGRQGLEFVIDKALRNADGGLTWRTREGEPGVTPYWRWGSAGIGMVLVRYLSVMDDPHLAIALNDLMIDTDRKYTIFPGQFFGLAGIGEFYLDLAELTDNPEKGLKGAMKALSGLLPFQVPWKGGDIAFPGESLARLSCDFGTGSAGIALFIHRLLTGCGSSFMLDSLLKGGSPRPRGPKDARVYEPVSSGYPPSSHSDAKGPK